MNYSEPQMNIFQVFEAALNTNVTPLHACIMGPKYGLHRFGVDGEEESVGSYDPSNQTVYPWPGKASGSVVDQNSAKVYAKDASLRYYEGSGEFTVPTGVTGGNRIEATTLVLESKNGYSRSAVFGNRDVAVGDLVKVAWDAVEINTMVTAVEGEVGSVVGSATADANNQPTVASAVGPVVQNQSFTDTDLSAAASGTYKGAKNGYVEETYTILVTQAGVSGVAKASVISASGTDDVSEIILNTTAAMDIGNRGAKATITDAATGAVFAVGDSFQVYAKQKYTPLPTLVSGGTYTGTKTTKYIVQITEGGVLGTDTPKFKVSTTNGYDIQAETAMTAGSMTIGNYGVTITFNDGDEFVKDDAWTAEATPSEERAMRTLVLATELTDGVNPATDADTLSVDLMLEDTVEIRSNDFSTDDTNLTLDANASVEDDYGDTGNDLPIVSGDIYIDYREALGGAVEFGSLSSSSRVADVLGPVEPENPLAYGMFKALENSNGVPVYYVSTTSDDLAGYTSALNRISTEDIIWSLVPMTKEADVIALVKAFVLEQSSPVNNNWKKGWFNSNAKQVESFYAEEGGSAIEATITDDAGGSNYVNVDSATADFTGAGVAKGDLLRYNYRPENNTTVWDTAEILSVGPGNGELTLKNSAIDMPIAANVEVWRTSSLTDFADTIAAESTALGDRRINNIWPDTIPNESGVEVEGYFLCAALAAYRSAAAPHQPLTRAQISGFGSPDRTTMFSREQLNRIASGGTWIVMSDISGAVYTRHQLTTDMTNEETREDSITSNLDSISRVYRDGFDDVVGKSNVTPDMLELLQGRVFTSFKYLHNLPYPRTLGPQMIGYDLLELAIDPVLRSKVRIRIKPELPLPLNYLDIFFYIGG